MMAQATDNRDNRKTETTKKLSIFVLGATGGTGSAVVLQALARGHQVRAFARAPDRLAPHLQLTTQQGDVRDAAAMAAMMRGSDLVISTLGRRDKNDPTLLADCMRSTLHAMKEAHVSRLIVVSSALLFPDVGILGLFLRRFVFTLAIADSARMEDIVKESRITWTIARPPRLLDRAPSGRFRAREGHLPPHGSSIARADLATFLIDEAEQAAHPRQVVGVAS